MKQIHILFIYFLFMNLTYGQEDGQWDFDMPIQMSGNLGGERLKLGFNYNYPPTFSFELLSQDELKKHLQTISCDSPFPELTFEFRSLSSNKNRFKLSEPPKQSPLIKSIVEYRKTKDGEWKFKAKHEYFFGPNRVEEILSHFEKNVWVEKEKRIRENTPNSDSIIIKAYKKDSIIWVLDNTKTAIKVKESLNKNNYIIRTDFFDKKRRKRIKEREKKFGRKFGNHVSTKVGKESQWILPLAPTTQMGSFIHQTTYSTQNDVRRKEFTPIGCGFSKIRTYKLQYDELGRLVELNAEEDSVMVSYK